MTFTDASIKRLAPRATAYRVFEGGALPGFHLVISPGGGKTFALQHTVAGKRSFFRIGAYPAMPLSAARELARGLLATLEQGGDPRAVVAPAATGGTVENLLAAWLKHQADNGRRCIRATELIIRNNLTPTLLAKPAAQVQPADIRAVLAVVHQRGARVRANRLRAHLHSMFSYGLKADHDPRRMSDPILFSLTVNPVSAIPRDAGAETPGERVLLWAEVRAVWHSESLTWPARQAVRLLLLTGARVNEVCQASWSEFDLEAGLWTLPAARSKNHRTLLTPILPLAAEMLGELRDIWPDSDWLFPARNCGSAARPWGSTALSHAVRNAQNELPRNPRQLSCQGFLDSWKPQDLRRTFKTLAGGCGIGRDILDRIQNHAAQDVASRHYDRHGYLEEKRAALESWERDLSARVAGDNVIVLPVRRRA